LGYSLQQSTNILDRDSLQNDSFFLLSHLKTALLNLTLKFFLDAS